MNCRLTHKEFNCVKLIETGLVKSCKAIVVNENVSDAIDLFSGFHIHDENVK